MKKLLFLLIAFSFIECNKKSEDSSIAPTSNEESAAPKSSVNTKIEPIPESGKFKLGQAELYLETNSKLSTIPSIVQSSEYSSLFDQTPVELQMELTELFNPSKFPCLDGKLKEKIQKLKRKSTSSTKEAKGFIPEEVEIAIEGMELNKAQNAYVLKYGANTLLHSFTYKDNANNTESKILHTEDAPTYKNFNLLEFTDKVNDGFPYLYYTMDCSGYFTASIKAAGGVSGNEVESSVGFSSSTQKSLVLIACKVQTPLFAAYNGEGTLSGTTKETYQRRLLILQSVLKKLPKNKPNISILIKANYFVVTASNSGEGGFNGTGKGDVSLGGNFGFAQVSSSAGASTKVTRKSEFNTFRTYVLDTDIGAQTFPIPLKDFKEVVKEIEDKIKEIEAKTKVG
jgi:hypothetical protein